MSVIHHRLGLVRSLANKYEQIVFDFSQSCLQLPWCFQPRSERRPDAIQLRDPYCFNNEFCSLSL